jgi:solute carrier family 25 protein 34/35
MALAGASGGMAVCFSHPLELTKVRLQLDNERAARGTPRMYAGWIDCVGKNWASDGVRGLQRGLSLGIAREVCFNAVRIGLLGTVTDTVHASGSALGLVDASAPPSGPERMVAGLTCGALGGCCVNPIEVVKTRFQALGGLTGHQLWRTEGLGGLMRGVGVSTLRGILGPGSQIVAYGELKSAAVARGADAKATTTHVGCALCSASVSVACVNPVDVTRTRLYNAPVGRYASGMDAARALVAHEGLLAFYKGALTHFLRLGPHMVLVFSILEKLRTVF